MLSKKKYLNVVRKMTPSYQLREKQADRVVMKIKHSKCMKTLNNLLKHVMHSSKIYLQNRKIQIRAIKSQHLRITSKVFQSQTELKTPVENFRNIGFYPVAENHADAGEFFSLPFSFLSPYLVFLNFPSTFPSIFSP